MPSLVPLSAVPSHLIDDLLDAAFEPERRTRTAYRIREGSDFLSALSFAALDDEQYLVGPVAVLPAHQGEGYGKALMTAALGAIDGLREEGAAPLAQVLIGDASYYARFGFAKAPHAWHCPGPWDPERLLVRGDPSMLPPAGLLGPWQGADSASLAN